MHCVVKPGEFRIGSLWLFNVEHVLISLSCLIFMFRLIHLRPLSAFIYFIAFMRLTDEIQIKAHQFMPSLGFEPMTSWSRAAVLPIMHVVLGFRGVCCDQGFSFRQSSSDLLISDTRRWGSGTAGSVFAFREDTSASEASWDARRDTTPTALILCLLNMNMAWWL